MSDGQLYQAANFVKATGGCSAPALKDAEQALASVGRMKVRRFEPQMTEASTSALREMQLMVRHPNYSGFQIDQVSQLHIPAYFVDEMEVRQGDELLFRMTGGISLSEDPTVRFSYVPNKAGSISVRVHDTDDATYTGDFPATPEG
jgi:sulfur-oxidizing protein SoxY